MAVPMEGQDFDWAAGLMERRRQRYAAYSPVFWRPAKGVAALHAESMRATASSDGAVALRTAHGFAVAYPHEGRCFVDDFAVEPDALWPTEGQELLLGIWHAARSPDRPLLRAVTARRDEPKRSLLADLGLAAAARWWVKELASTAAAPAWGPVDLDGVDALIVPAPPVYDPGGPVCLLGDLDADRAGDAAAAAARHGAVLAVVQRDRSPDPAPVDEPVLEALGFHNPSEFYEGSPSAS